MWKPTKIISYHIAIDFDGTCVTNEFPNVGKDIGAQIVLHKLIKKGHKLILNTIRGGIYLQAAIDWFKENDIKLHAINESISKTDNASNKVYCKYNIDDCNVGTPLIHDKGCKPYVNWIEVEKILINNKVL